MRRWERDDNSGRGRVAEADAAAELAAGRETEAMNNLYQKCPKCGGIGSKYTVRTGPGFRGNDPTTMMPCDCQVLGVVPVPVPPEIDALRWGHDESPDEFTVCLSDGTEIAAAETPLQADKFEAAHNAALDACAARALTIASTRMASVCNAVGSIRRGKEGAWDHE